MNFSERTIAYLLVLSAALPATRAFAQKFSLPPNRASSCAKSVISPMLEINSRSEGRNTSVSEMLGNGERALIQKFTNGRSYYFVKDLRTGDERPLPTSLMPPAQPSKNGDYASFPGADGKLAVVDLRTMKVTSHDIPPGARYAGFLGNTDRLAFRAKTATGSTLHVSPADSSAIDTYEIDDSFYGGEALESADGKRIFYKDFKGHPTYLDLEHIESPPPHAPFSGPVQAVSSDGKTVFRLTDNEWIATDLASGHEKHVKFAEIDPANLRSPGRYSGGISPTGRYVLYAGKGGKNVLFDMEKLTAASTDGNEFSADGSSLLRRGSVVIRQYSLPLEELDLSSGVGIETGPTSCSFTEPKPTTELLKQVACQEDFAPEAWAALTASPGAGVMAEADADRWLLRLQKPGGFEPKKHIAVLMGLLGSTFPERRPGAIAAVMQNVLATSPPLYDSLLECIPWLKSKEFLTAILEDAEPPCRTQNEEKKIASSARDALKKLVDRNLPVSTLTSWETLTPLSSALKRLPAEEKETYSDLIAQSLADHAKQGPYPDVYISKLYYLSLEPTMAFFGQKPQVKTDLTLVRTPSSIRPIIFGTVPIDGDSYYATDYGFHAKPLFATSITAGLAPGTPVLEKTTIEWSQQGEKFKAQLQASIAKSPPSSFLQTAKGPDYASLWKGGLNGMLVAGAGMTAEPWFFPKAMAYYLDEGFTMSKPVTIEDAPALMKAEVSSGRLKYLLRDSHGEGNDKDIIRMPKQARMVTGTRVNPADPNGPRESITIIAPLPKDGDSQLLSANEFASWLKQRETSGGGQIVCVSSICSAYVRTRNEIEAAQSKLLLSIPSRSLADGFYFEDTNAAKLVIDGIRQSKDFAGMRELLKKNPDYSSGTKNVFIFPDENAYRELITDRLSVPLDIDLTIQDGSGKPYSIDSRD
jgi:NAD(P)-dependent dehydrogenase (short-subunit alcohol dehydrogenase family)